MRYVVFRTKKDDPPSSIRTVWSEGKRICHVNSGFTPQNTCIYSNSPR